MKGSAPLSGDYLHVAAAVVVDEAGRILIARRPDHLHQGGLWEFPGGKVEAGESVPAALARELQEEVGIRVHSARPLIRIPYSYPDRHVLLDVWRVEKFAGEAHGVEGQPVRWVEADALRRYTFPAANTAIVTAARLPSAYLITPEPDLSAGFSPFLEALRAMLSRGIRLIQLRAKCLPKATLLTLAHEVMVLCREPGCALLVNCDPAWACELPEGCGLHLNSAALYRVQGRPIAAERWLAASCHCVADVAQAQQIGCDFVVVSPIKPTATHPDSLPLGWDGLRAITEQTMVPVYALGGMTRADLELSWAHGAQGIAAIRGIWDERDMHWC
ncbi:MAG TPA: Nudix family hydrolase [Gammaproteobacteria bacterium]